jgi:Ca-activated chloride channel family protein
MTLPQLGSLAFAHPWVLLFLLALPLLAWLRGRRGSAPAVVFSSVEPLRSVGRLRKSRAGALLTSLLFAALAFFIIALARPQQGKEMSQVQASGVDIMLALDVSRSMLAEDFTIGSERANRLEAVKQVTEKFIEGRPNDRIGIVAFAGRPYLVSPLTLDHDWLLQNLERLRVGLVEDGTAIGSAIASSANRLKARESKSKMILLLTDGDNNSGKVTPETAAEAARALGIKIYAIGAGTRGYAPVPIPMYGQTVYRNVKVEVDEETLKKIAHIANGQFYRATDSKSLEQIYKQIDALERSVVETRRYTRYRDLFAWFLVPGFALLTLQMVLGQTALRRLP